MTRNTMNQTSRRNFLKLTAATAAFGPFFLFPDRALASQKTLSIAKWTHFLPEFDQWFVNVLAREWGQQNNSKVTVDVIPVEEVRERAFAEVKAGKGHDISIFPWSPAEFYPHVIEHDEIYDMAASRYGAIQQLAFRSTYNARTKKHFAFADFFMPSPLHFFQDYWAEVGMPLGPVHYFSLRGGGRELRKKLGVPSGLAFSPTLEGNVTLHTILYAFRAWLLDGRGMLFFTRTELVVTGLSNTRVPSQRSGLPDRPTGTPEGKVAAWRARKLLPRPMPSVSCVPQKNRILRWPRT